MKVSHSLSLLLVLTVACLSFLSLRGDINTDGSEIQLSAMFTQWKSEFNKNYGNQMEEIYRLTIFKHNIQIIETHNSQKDKTYEKGLNQFSDLTEEEFAATYLTFIPKSQQSLQIESTEQISDDEEINWVEKGYVTSIKDEGACGACWAFAAIGPLEAMIKQQGKPLVSLSAQQLMDCSNSYGNYGCNGGYMDSSYKYIKDKGITTEDKYPYKGAFQKCIVDGGEYKVNGFVDIKDCKTLASALLKIPIAVAVDATKFYNYKSGVFNDCSSKPQLNHALAFVGMTSEYWLGKEQWGLKWGENGYIRISKAGNACGACLMDS